MEDMEHEQKPSIAFLNKQEELLITDVRGSIDMNILETNFNENSESTDSEILGNPYDASDSRYKGNYTEGYIKEEKARELIKAIERYPLIYDPSHSRYLNNDERNKAWEDVAKQAKYCNVQEAQKKWRNMRDYYKGILQKQKDHPVTDPAERRQWTYTNEMKFMDNILKKNLPQKRSASPNHSSDSEDLSGTSSPNNRTFEKHLKSVENTNNMIMEYLQKKMKNAEEKKDDSLSVFFQSMEESVRTFSKARQLEVKCKLSAIIYGAEAAEMKERLGMTDDNAVPMNFSTPGSSTNMYLNPNIPNMPYQNPNPHPYSTQPYHPQQNYAPRAFPPQYASYQAQTMQFQAQTMRQRMSQVINSQTSNK